MRIPDILDSKDALIPAILLRVSVKALRILFLVNKEIATIKGTQAKMIKAKIQLIVNK